MISDTNAHKASSSGAGIQFLPRIQPSLLDFSSPKISYSVFLFLSLLEMGPFACQYKYSDILPRKTLLFCPAVRGRHSILIDLSPGVCPLYNPFCQLANLFPGFVPSPFPHPPADAGDRRCQSNSWVGKIPWRMKWQPTPEFLPGELHGQRSLAG